MIQAAQIIMMFCALVVVGLAIYGGFLAGRAQEIADRMEKPLDLPSQREYLKRMKRED